MFERLKSLIGGANIAGAAAVKKKTITDIGREVIAGDWGNGDERIAALKRKGYNPDEVQKEVHRLLSCRELIIQNMRAWAIKTSAEPYRYVYWTEPYGHECAKCHPHGGKNKGWQCIGWVIACWHHGGGLPIPCNCGVLDNGTCERILKAKTDAEALQIAQKELKIKDIKVIRNGGKLIPKSWVQPGDIGALFTGNVFQHLIMFMGNNKLTDSTDARIDANDIRADRSFSGRYVSRLKLIIRYTGKGLTKPEKKSVDTLAHEVLDDMWYSGDVRKRALTECHYDYDAVQKRVDEILNPPKPTPKPTPKPSKKGYTGAYPTVSEIKKETKRNYLKKGDKGESVKKLQKYLNWYSDGKFFKESGNADGIYGANTLKWCKKFQEKELGKGEGDGTVGKKTIAAMKKVKK